MKKIIGIGAVICLSFAVCVPLAAQSGGEVIFKALQDELDRSVSDLVMDDLERPYFIGYTVDDVQDLIVRASLGALVNSQFGRSRYLTVDLRVGDYSLDNTNFIAGFYGRGPHYSPITMEDDYDALRNRIYLATDAAYKNALKAISKKRAYLQTRVIKDRPDDFIKQPANTYADRPEPFDLDRTYLDNLARVASAVFRDYPSIISSEARLTAAVTNQYLVNSGGTRTLRADRLYTVELFISGKNAEGEDLRDAARIIVTRREDLPEAASLAEWAREHAERMVALIGAEEIKEYAGPVILVGDAAGEFFRQVFARHITNAPAPTYADERMSSMAAGPKLAGKIRRRVLPQFFDVYDDPTISRLDGMDLVGSFPVDDAGYVPRRVQLVEKGKLINLPIGVAPTKKITEPTGHARGAVSKEVTAKPGNIVFESTARTSFKKLKESMLKLCADFDLEYGLIITRLEDLNAPRAGFSYFGGRSTSEGALTPPLEGYKVFPDGREEPVRNLEFANVTVRSLRDILQTGQEQHAYHYLIGNDYEMPATIVCPDILIEEMELEKTEARIKKPPILPSPLAEK
jgi:predicted Zn-dependent protease